MPRARLELADVTRMAALAAVLRQALVDTWPALSDAWTPVGSIRQRLHMDAKALALRCKALVHFGWIEERNDEVRRTGGRARQDVEAWLAILAYYASFAERTCPRLLDGRASSDYFGMLSAVAPPTTRWLVARYGRSGAARRVLDYGCGMAPHTQELAAAAAEIECTLVDRGEAFARMKRHVAGSALAHRFRVIEARDSRWSLGRKYDLILLLNVLHEMPRSAQSRLLARLSRRLAAGGEVVIQVFCRDGRPGWHADGLEMATAIRLHAPGDVLEIRDYKAMLAAVGLEVMLMPNINVPVGRANRLLVARATSDESR